LADTAEVAAALMDLIREKPNPIITSWVGGVDMQKGRDIFNQAGITTFDTPERAVRAFMDIYHFSKNIEMLQQIPSRLPRRPEFDRETAKNLIREGLGTQDYLLTEMEAKALLSSYRIPVNRMEKAVTKEEVVQKAQMILFGMDGVYAEVLQDRAIAFPPLNRLRANRIMKETKVYRLLRGYRNTKPANLQLLEETLIRLAQLVTDFSGITELDINPLLSAVILYVRSMPEPY
jgi:acetyltransferase